jgi:hypothetical protein
MNSVRPLFISAYPPVGRGLAAMFLDGDLIQFNALSIEWSAMAAMYTYLHTAA